MQGESGEGHNISGFSELNLNKKIIGIKKPNPSPVLTRADAEKMLSPIAIAKRIVIMGVFKSG